MDNDDLESLLWIEDEETKRLAKELYTEQMIAELEKEENGTRKVATDYR